MPALGTVDEIELSTHNPGQAYIAVQRYRLDDFRPYVFRTDDYGISWTLVVDGIPEDYPVRTVREDPEHEGLLFAGTEFGVFVTLNGGSTWQSFQKNLPITPVTGMRVAHDDLILSTQGRSFWILDDISPLREIGAAVESDNYLFKPRTAVRLTNMGAASMAELTPDPRPTGALIHYYLAQEPNEEVRIEVVDDRGEVVHIFSSDSITAEESSGQKIDKSPGLNRLAWQMFYPGPEMPESAVVWGYTGGVVAPPGTYRVRMTIGEQVQEQSFQLLPDPRIPDVTLSSYQEQFRIALEVRDSINSISRAIEDLATIREQVQGVMDRAESVGQADVLQELGDTLNNKSTSITEDLMQPNNRSAQDPIRFLPRLDNQWLELYGRITGTDGYIYGGAEGAPHEGTTERLSVLIDEWDVAHSRYLELLENELQRFNNTVERLGLPAIVLPRRGRLVS